MTTQQGSSVKWIVIGLVAVLACCLCLAIVLGAAAVLPAWWITQRDLALPTFNVGPTAPPVPTPVMSDSPEAMSQNSAFTAKLWGVPV